MTHVFAAASLRECLEAMGKDYEALHAGQRLRFSFGGSQTLQAQIEHGAQPHVFVAASCRHTEALHRQKRSGVSHPFAQNLLVLVVPKNNPSGIHKFNDIQKARRLVLPADSVPAGDYAAQVLGKWARSHGPAAMQRVEQAVVSRESHVRLVLQKVALGEADAGLVYATDVQAAPDKVTVIPIPETFAVSARYCFAEVIKKLPHKSNSFAAFLSSDKARMHLRKFGFGDPPSKPTNEPRRLQP